MSHWAQSPLDRMQVAMFSPTLDDSLAADHPVRLFDEIFNAIDFSDFTSMYVRVAGQPPIHPRIMAKGLVFGMTVGVRSSRRLEDACCNRLDFIWLMEGHTPDHSTFCKFRTQFGPQIKKVFSQVGRIGIELGLVTLNQVTLDGTAIRANNSRYNTARRASLEQKVAALDQQVEELMKLAGEQDEADNAMFGETSPVKLPAGLKDLRRRQAQLKDAMKRLEELEKTNRAGRKDVSAKGPAVPLADPDSRVLPNKNGGHAPNYTGVLSVDSDSGIIVDTRVLGGNDEASTVLDAMSDIEQNMGQRPKEAAADSGFNTGRNLAGLEESNIQPLMPARQEFKENPALRPDPTVPVPPEQHDKLPMNPQNKVVDKAAFIYDEQQDRYLCPMGQSLNYLENKGYNRDGQKGVYRIYQCGACAGCPLASRCLPRKAKQRRLCRDEYESHRQRMAARMKTDEGKGRYKRRFHAAETPFAVLKTTMNFRQFLLRGLKKVDIEQRWMCIAYNLRKLVRFKAAQLLAAASPVPAT